MSDKVKDTVNLSENVMVKEVECDYNPANKMSFYVKFMSRMSLVSIGVLIFMFAFLKATQIARFNTSKLLLLEVCLLILCLAFICIAVVLAKIWHKCTAHRVVALLIYVSALLAIMLMMIVWAFFKASW